MDPIDIDGQSDDTNLLIDDFDAFIAPIGALCAVISCIEDARTRATARQLAHRTYLCRPQLLPNPRAGTPWQHLLSSGNDRAFITTMGVNVGVFQFILQSGFADLWNSVPIPRHDTSRSGAPRLAARSLDAAGALGLYLHWVTSTMRDTSLQEIFALIPSTVSRYVQFAEDILHTVLKNIPEAKISWPSGEEFEQYSQLIQARHRRLVGSFGSLDGLKLPIQHSYEDPDLQNATYNGWLHSHCISSVMAFAPDGTIMAAQVNAPGSWHDSRVARPIYNILEQQTPDGYYLVCDTAFPHGMDQVSGRLKAPLKDGDTAPSDPALQAEVMAFNRQLLSYRQTAEWGMRQIQGAFGRLRLPLNVYESERRSILLEVVVRLNNIRARLIGISQIRNVYMPIWRDADGDDLWDSLGDTLLSDIRRKDRVSRFHVVFAQA